MQNKIKLIRNTAFIIITCLSILMLVGCGLIFTTNQNETPKMSRNYFVYYNDTETEVSEGETFKVQSDDENFLGWEIDGEIVSLEKEFAFTVNESLFIEPVLKSVNKKQLEDKVYFYVRSSILEEQNAVCNVYVPKSIKVEEFGFVYTTDKNDIGSAMTEWNGINKVTCIDMINSYEFSALLKEAKAFCAYIITDNGINKEVQVYHYSEIVRLVD